MRSVVRVHSSPFTSFLLFEVKIMHLENRIPSHLVRARWNTSNQTNQSEHSSLYANEGEGSNRFLLSAHRKMLFIPEGSGKGRRKGADCKRSSEKGRGADAPAPGAEEGRDKLRKARGSRKWAVIPGYPNGETRMSRPHALQDEEGKPG